MAPGEHLFTSWSGGTNSLRATLAPGRVYFVEVAMKPGAFPARAHLLAIAPRTESWASVREWMADTKPTVADRNAGQAYLDGRKDDVAERLRRAAEAFAEMDDEERDARTLHPNDGLAQSL